MREREREKREKESAFWNYKSEGKEGKFESKERNGNYKVMKTIENNNREE